MNLTFTGRHPLLKIGRAKEQFLGTNGKRVKMKEGSLIVMDDGYLLHSLPGGDRRILRQRNNLNYNPTRI